MAEKALCQRCEVAPATVVLEIEINGKKRRWRLCDNCARMQEKLKEIQKVPEFFKKFVETLFGAEVEKETDLQCPSCKLTLREFEKSGLFGCETCYETFADELEILLRRIHGSNKHIGSRPRPARVIGNTPDLGALKAELRAAIENENYERAAEYRDMIRDLERELQRQDQSKTKEK